MLKTLYILQLEQIGGSDDSTGVGYAAIQMAQNRQHGMGRLLPVRKWPCMWVGVVGMLCGICTIHGGQYSSLTAEWWLGFPTARTQIEFAAPVLYLNTLA